MTSLYDFSSLFFRSDFLPLGAFSGVPTELLVSVAPSSDLAPGSEPVVICSSSDFKGSFAERTLLSGTGFYEGDVDWEGISMVSFTSSFGVAATSFKGSFSGLAFAYGFSFA